MEYYNELHDTKAIFKSEPRMKKIMANEAKQLFVIFAVYQTFTKTSSNVCIYTLNEHLH